MKSCQDLEEFLFDLYCHIDNNQLFFRFPLELPLEREVDFCVEELFAGALTRELLREGA